MRSSAEHCFVPSLRLRSQQGGAFSGRTPTAVQQMSYAGRHYELRRPTSALPWIEVAQVLHVAAALLDVPLQPIVHALRTQSTCGRWTRPAVQRRTQPKRMPDLDAVLALVDLADEGVLESTGVVGHLSPVQSKPHLEKRILPLLLRVTHDPLRGSMPAPILSELHVRVKCIDFGCCTAVYGRYDGDASGSAPYQ